MNPAIVKTKTGKPSDLYEVQYVEKLSTIGDELFACYRLSAYDGMLIGPIVFIPASELIPEDVTRLRAYRRIWEPKK